MAGWSGCGTTSTLKKPSKPPGCRSRRCRRRTWSRPEGVDALNKGDVDACLETMDPDVSFAPIRSQIEGVYRGHAGVRRWFADNIESFESFRVNPTETRDLGGDRLLMIGVLHLRARGSGNRDGPRHSWDRGTPRWSADRLEGLRGKAEGPRSRRAVGVGDVAGERGGCASRSMRTGSAATSARPSGCTPRSSS